MKQVLVAGIILGAIGLSLVLVPPARLWTMTEKWKTTRSLPLRRENR